MGLLGGHDMTNDMRSFHGVRMASHKNKSSNNEILGVLADYAESFLGQPRHLALRDLAKNTLDADFWMGLGRCHQKRITNTNGSILFTESNLTYYMDSVSTISCLDEQVSQLGGGGQSQSGVMQSSGAGEQSSSGGQQSSIEEEQSSGNPQTRRTREQNALGARERRETVPTVNGEQGGNQNTPGDRVLTVFGNLNDFEKLIIGLRIVDTMNHAGGEAEYQGIFAVRQYYSLVFM